MFFLKNILYKGILTIPALDIPEGKITCLFGPSGCGKTTLLRLLNHLISPDEGQVFFQGEDISRIDAIALRRNVLMLPQQSVIYPGNLRDNLNIGAIFQDRPSFQNATLCDILKKTGLGEKDLEDDPNLFSGGEKQRLALARVLLLEPPVLLLDEPGSALDSAMESAIMNLILEDHKKRHTTCILVTHSEQMSKTYSDFIIYMQDGQIRRIAAKENNFLGGESL